MRRLLVPLVLLLLNGCVSARRYAELNAARQRQEAQLTEQQRAAQETELALAKEQVRGLLARTRLDQHAAALAATNAQLGAERAAHTQLEAAHAKLLRAAAARRPAPEAAELKATREQLRQQTSQLESAGRASRDSVTRQTQLLQQARAGARALEQTVADRERTIGELRQRLAGALNQQGVNVRLRGGKLTITAPDQPIRSLLKKWRD